MEKPFVVQIQELEDALIQIKAELEEFQKNTSEKNILPYTKTGGIKDQSQQKAVDISTGLSQTFSGSVVWNDAELKFPGFGIELGLELAPTKGYNRHSHSRFSGGALDINTLEIVEYERNEDNQTIDDEGNKGNQDCQSLWKKLPTIKKEDNLDSKSVAKLGKLDLIFNPNFGKDEQNNPIGKWGVATYEIDVKKCYLVSRDEDGNIELDENGKEMKALLYNKDLTKTNIVWDKLAKCWRIYAVFAESQEA